MPNHFDSQDIDNLNEQLKEAKKQKRQAEKEAKKQHRKADAYAGVEDWLKDTSINYIGQIDRYVVQDEDGNWCLLKAAALPKLFPILNDSDVMEALPMAMEEAGRTYLYCTYAFNDYPQTLNLMDTSSFLAPKEGQHHWAFDVLMRSLGSGKPENIEHIQQVLAYKYEHPECWRLPCLLFFGEGGVGKNLLVDLVLYKLYSRRTVSATSDNLISTFNSLLKGMMAVCINETVVGKHDNSKLYNTLNKARIEINEKCVPQYTVDNTPLYMIGSNDWNGGALLDRSDADRRMSVMRCEKGKTLKYWLAQHMGTDEQEAQQWLNKHADSVFGNPDEISKWLNYLLGTYGGGEMPEALHRADYEKLLDVQEQVDERIAKTVFEAEDFEYISIHDLYEGYVCCCKTTGTRTIMKDRTFNTKIELWLQTHLPHVVKQTHKQHYYDVQDGDYKNKVRRQREKTVWINTQAACHPTENNRHMYFDEGAIGHMPPKWKLEI